MNGARTATDARISLFEAIWADPAFHERLKALIEDWVASPGHEVFVLERMWRR